MDTVAIKVVNALKKNKRFTLLGESNAALLNFLWRTQWHLHLQNITEYDIKMSNVSAILTLTR